MKKLSIVLFVGLVLGYGFGAVLSPLSGKKDREELPEGRELDFPAAVEVAVPAVDMEKLAALEAERDRALQELEELKVALDNSRAETASYVAQVDQLKQGDEPRRESSERRRESWQERQERWKKENPEEYEAHQTRMKEFQDRLDGAIAEKSAFLVNLDTTEMNEQEKKDHEELLGRVAEAWELMNGMQQGQWPSREQWGDVRENMTAIRDLYDKERDYVLRQVGKDLGYDDVKAAEFSTYMKDIFEKTSPQLPMSSFGGWGRHGGRSGRHSRQEGQGTGGDAQAQPQAPAEVQ